MKTVDLRLGLLGSPVKHSLSKELHEGFGKGAGIPVQYDLIETTPETLQATLERCKNEGFLGVNLTTPLKTAVLPYLDYIDPEIALVGSVNTLVFRKGYIFGYNTDYMAFKAIIDEDIDPMGEDIVVCGAGGAARAVILALLHRGYDVRIANKSIENARKLVNSFKKEGKIGLWHGGIAGQVVNTCLPSAPKDFYDSLRIKSLEKAIDVNYFDAPSGFKQFAESQGAEYLNGFKMLQEQARYAFAIWVACSAD